MARCRDSLLFFLAMVLVSSAVWAQVAEGLDSERFRPAFDSQGGFWTEAGQGEEAGNLNLGFYLHYSNDPLVIARGNDIVERLVAHRVAGNFFFSMGVTDWLALGVDVPAAFYQDGTVVDGVTGVQDTLQSATLGDIRAAVKFTLLREQKHGIALGLLLPVTLQSGDELAYMGSKSTTLSPTLALSRHLLGQRLLMMLNVGAWLLPEDTEYRDLSVGHEMFYRLGLSFELSQGLSAVGELFEAGKLDNLFKNKPNETPMEWLLGLRYRSASGLSYSVGGGGGLLPGWGTPNFRVFVGLLWSPRVHDQDQDGLADEDDSCPAVAGPLENTGCPWGDKDGDGRMDNVDQCPDDPGPTENQGCPWPDSDGDGLTDNVDDCPKQAEDKDGYQDDNGCPDPDNDNDGILDASDSCPLQAGKPEHNGCPFIDTDQDGIEDAKDRCPKEPGPKDNEGCPYRDSDGDGWMDHEDQCPNEPEDKDFFSDEDGCPDPDNDKDGILDIDDKCPNEAETINGIQDQDGCPDKGRVLVIIRKDKIEILQKVHFASGKARILRNSFNLLNQVAQVLRGHTEIKKIRIEGHTDSKGSERANQRLSDRRAQAVRVFLEKRGDIDPARLDAVGYGESRPIASNKTRKGRSANRRVEFVIVESE